MMCNKACWTGAAFCRVQQDASVTIDDKQYDYMQHLDNILVVGGEDVSQRQLINAAVESLLDKHTGANPAFYGHLNYLILFATAGNAVRFFALQLHANALLSHSWQSLCCVTNQLNLP